MAASFSFVQMNASPMRLDAVLLAGLALAWLPANHYHPWASAWQEGLALLLLAVAVALSSRAGRIPWPWAAFALLALSSVAGQAMLGPILFLGDAWIVAVYLIAFALAIVVGGTLVDDTPDRGARRLEWVCLALVAAAIVSAGIGFAQWAGVQRLGIYGADLKPGARPFANFGQPNHWCTASLMGLGAAWVLYEARRIGGLTFSLIAAVLLMAMVASGSRTGWLQLGVGLLLLVGLRQRAGLRLHPAAAALALLAFTAAWLAWPVLNAEATPGTARSVAEQAQVGVRGPLWQAMLQAMAEQPWTGYGWQQMVLAQQAVALERPPLHIHFEHAHNLLLDLLIWTGLPVGLALIALAAWGLWRLFAGTTDARAAGLLLAVGGVLVHAMLEFAAEYAYFLLPMGVLIGATHGLSLRSPASFVVRVVHARVAGVLLLAMLVPTGIDYAQAEQSHRLLRFESARIGTSRIESPPPKLIVLTQLEAFLAFARREPEAHAEPGDLAMAQRVASRFAYPPAQYRLAQWQALNGDPAGAAHTLRLLCAMHPPVHCRDVIASWSATRAQVPALAAVPLPTSPP